MGRARGRPAVIAPDPAPPPAIQAAAATGFAPRLDHPYRYRIDQQRDEAGATRHYATERTIVFHRTPTGIVADLTITAADGGLSDGPGALFERAFAGLRGRVIRYRLSPAGAVMEVEDRGTLWSSLIDAVIAQGGTNPERAAIARRLAEPLRHIPDAQQVAMLGSMLATVLAPSVVTGGVRPERAIRQPGLPPFGAGSIVTGTGRVYRQGDALVEERRMAGDLAATGGTTGSRATTLMRTVDATTGLIRSQAETIRTQAGPATSIATTRISLLNP